MMRNSPTSLFVAAEDEEDEPDRRWPMDAQPSARLGVLFGLMVLPLLVVIGRVTWLQGMAVERFIAGFDRTTETLEPIATRDGRILGADGRVLACDVERFGIRAHYRWLEEPADPDWLRRQALAHLSPAERRDPQRVAREEDRVLSQRDQMWRDLAALSGRRSEELAEARQRIQRRVERIIAHVAERRQERTAEPPDAVPSSDATAGERLWHFVRSALTTPPHRESRAPVVVREELDFHPLLDDVPLDVAARIESQPERFPGLRVETEQRRIYPAGSLAPHVIGTRTPITDEELAARRAQFPHGDPLDYRPGDRIGRTGIERSYDRRLRGLRGVRRVVRDRRGKTIRTEIVREPRPGQDVILTVNLPLQERLEGLLDTALTAPPAAESADEGAEPPPLPAGGSIVVLDVRTGAVVAAVSGPRHDLAAMARGDAAAWERMTADPRRPFFHRAVQMTVAPGSVFKALTAVALLESRLIDPDERFVCQGWYGPRDDRNRCLVYTRFGVGHFDTNLTDALARSCNVYFFAAAEKIGPQRIVTWAERFGFGQPTGIDLPDERGGNLPRPRESGERRAESGELEMISHRLPSSGSPPSALRSPPWYSGDTLGLAIGQSRLTVTPLQIARMMAAIGNGGWLVVPHVARDVVVEPQRIEELSAESLRRVREGLERVVAHPQGTGYKTVRLKEVAIAGKTGTAEVGRTKEDHAWFAGYVPADRPRYAFAVVLEHAGSGGHAAGPVARRMVQAMLELGMLPK